MRLVQCLLSAAAASSMFACDQNNDTLSSPASDNTAAFAAGFVTSQPAQARAILPQAQVKPIITVGDPIPGATDADAEQRVWAPIPDGLGAFQTGEGLVLFANHEISSAGVGGRFRNARVSRLVLDPSTLSVKSGSYAISGQRSSGPPVGPLVQRLCAATFNGTAEGFLPGWFFTGEETVTATSGGMQLAISNDGSQIRQLPWLGRIAHENYISVPGFGNKLVLIGTDDNNGASELYMYVANSAADVLAGSGKLYAFASDQPIHSGNLTPGQTITGQFLEIADPTALPGALQTQVDNLGDHGAMPFVRLEDIDYSRSEDESGPAVYFVDTGNDLTSGRTAGKVNVQCNPAPCDRSGSIYRMELNAANPTAGVRLTLLARSRGVAAGDWASPDNIEVSRKSLMLQEDPAYGGFNRAERVWNFQLKHGGGLAEARAVVELENQKFTGRVCSDAAGTCWESSGIIDASEWLGEGTWLFDVQAHTLPFSYQDGTTTVNLPNEGGQLLYLRLPGS
jgi:glycerophosphoryl diester phosphodiesterase